ncbi:hypothetical protein SAMD00019534_012440 [Acytostelium subglobosum LB1]|uniref:hypothetical protein n=1 Tax=Acytostelium subglobosum LB1 TaxID=1410327 RepID=UPI0006451C3A|nr:hypothetical protein SAMD00019534_012440 [Acytostelium subglobosum LB1]GAM18069.1 hypothetical protein SAMD00019534_012440 [Acytostelium subglobosum LB1]|eukprot:XP_012758665.1 hypothetical protein SAMD00019534_012440 [Acytostelium subglobosum LB1]
MSTVSKLPLNNEIELITEEVDKGFEDSNLIRKFLEKRIQIEDEYAKNLQKLVKSQPSLTKLGGISGAFSVILDNTNQYCNHVIQTMQRMSEDVNTSLKNFLKELKNEQKNYILDGQNLAKERKEIFDALRNAKAKYDSVSAFPDSDQSKMKEAEEEYKQQVAAVNRYQALFHNEKLPKIQNDFQRLETMRMQRMKTNLKKYVGEWETFPQKLSLSMKASEDSVNAIDTKKDIMTFVHFNKSLNNQWPDFIFEQCDKKKKNSGWRSTVAALKNVGGGSSAGQPAPSHKDLMNSYVPNTQKQDASNNHPNAVFGVALADVMEKQRTRFPDFNVPYVLVLLVSQIKQLNGLQTEGIFRIPGHNADVIAIKKRFNEGDYTLAENNVHTVTSTLKAFMREMPQALIPDAMYEAFVSCDTGTEMANVVQKLAPVNQRCLTYMSHFLKELTLPENVQHSKMTIDNMSISFAPSLLRCSNPELFMTNIEREKNFIRVLIEAHAELLEAFPLKLGGLDSVGSGGGGGGGSTYSAPLDRSGPPPLARTYKERSDTVTAASPPPLASYHPLTSSYDDYQYPAAASAAAHSPQPPPLSSMSSDQSPSRPLPAPRQMPVPVPRQMPVPVPSQGQGHGQNLNRSLNKQQTQALQQQSSSPPPLSSSPIDAPPRVRPPRPPNAPTVNGEHHNTPTNNNNTSGGPPPPLRSPDKGGAAMSPPPLAPVDRERKFSIFSNLPPPPTMPH